ncbi:hypothetical protein FB451DRAFT_1177655 [Mycena latifolia]|nr:hypothetical protein FB451DRAFT_1177655 [Mycena latifolia]
MLSLRGEWHLRKGGAVRAAPPPTRQSTPRTGVTPYREPHVHNPAQIRWRSCVRGTGPGHGRALLRPACGSPPLRRAPFASAGSLHAAERVRREGGASSGGGRDVCIVVLLQEGGTKNGSVAEAANDGGAGREGGRDAPRNARSVAAVPRGGGKLVEDKRAIRRDTLCANGQRIDPDSRARAESALVLRWTRCARVGAVSESTWSRVSETVHEKAARFEDATVAACSTKRSARLRALRARRPVPSESRQLDSTRAGLAAEDADHLSIVHLTCAARGECLEQNESILRDVIRDTNAARDFNSWHELTADVCITGRRFAGAYTRAACPHYIQPKDGESARSDVRGLASSQEAKKPKPWLCKAKPSQSQGFGLRCGKPKARAASPGFDRLNSTLSRGTFLGGQFSTRRPKISTCKVTCLFNLRQNNLGHALKAMKCREPFFGQSPVKASQAKPKTSLSARFCDVPVIYVRVANKARCVARKRKWGGDGEGGDPWARTISVRVVQTSKVTAVRAVGFSNEHLLQEAYQLVAENLTHSVHPPNQSFTGPFAHIGVGMLRDTRAPHRIAKPRQQLPPTQNHHLVYFHPYWSSRARRAVLPQHHLELSWQEETCRRRPVLREAKLGRGVFVHGDLVVCGGEEEDVFDSETRVLHGLKMKIVVDYGTSLGRRTNTWRTDRRSRTTSIRWHWQIQCRGVDREHFEGREKVTQKQPSTGMMVSATAVRDFRRARNPYILEGRKALGAETAVQNHPEKRKKTSFILPPRSGSLNDMCLSGDALAPLLKGKIIAEKNFRGLKLWKRRSDYGYGRMMRWQASFYPEAVKSQCWEGSVRANLEFEPVESLIRKLLQWKAERRTCKNLGRIED